MAIVADERVLRLVVGHRDRTRAALRHEPAILALMNDAVPRRFKKSITCSFASSALRIARAMDRLKMLRFPAFSFSRRSTTSTSGSGPGRTPSSERMSRSGNSRAAGTTRPGARKWLHVRRRRPQDEHRTGTPAALRRPPGVVTRRPFLPLVCPLVFLVDDDEPEVRLRRNNKTPRGPITTSYFPSRMACHISKCSPSARPLCMTATRPGNRFRTGAPSAASAISRVPAQSPASPSIQRGQVPPGTPQSSRCLSPRAAETSRVRRCPLRGSGAPAPSSSAATISSTAAAWLTTVSDGASRWAYVLPASGSRTAVTSSITAPDLQLPDLGAPPASGPASALATTDPPSSASASSSTARRIAAGEPSSRSAAARPRASISPAANRSPARLGGSPLAGPGGTTAARTPSQQ